MKAIQNRLERLEASYMPTAIEPRRVEVIGDDGPIPIEHEVKRLEAEGVAMVVILSGPRPKS